MSFLKMRLRTLMILIALLALILGGISFGIREVNRGLYEFYGPGGTLERQGTLSSQSLPPPKTPASTAKP